MKKLRWFIFFYQKVFLLTLFLSLLSFLLTYTGVVLIALLGIGIDYFLKFLFQQNRLLFYKNFSFSLFTLYGLSFLLNIALVYGLHELWQQLLG